MNWGNDEVVGIYYLFEKRIIEDLDCSYDITVFSQYPKKWICVKHASIVSEFVLKILWEWLLCPLQGILEEITIISLISQMRKTKP